MENKNEKMNHEEKTILKNPQLFQYILETSVYPREHECLKELRQITAKHVMNVMASTPDEIQFLSMLLKLINAKNTLEIGVFTGYSLLATALALPKDGKVLAIDISREYYQIGLPLINKAGVTHKIDFQEGVALDILDQMLRKENCIGSMDFAFVDADKLNYLKYHKKVLELVKIGGIIAYDNTLWSGSVAESVNEEWPKYIKDSRNFIIEFNKYLAADSRIEICQLSIADGLTLCRRLS